VVTVGPVQVVIPTVLPPAAASDSSRCKPPEPQLDYSVDRIVMSLRLDLSGCRWWKGDSITLEGEILRDAVVLSEGVAAQKICFALLAISAEKSSKGSGSTVKPRDKPPRPRVTRCTLKLQLDHQPVEAARYVGSFTHPWRDGPRTVEFDYICLSALVETNCRAG